MITIVDRLLVKSFIGPFIVTFAIAVFFFLMQTLWFYIDDIIGKGLGFFFIVELLAYKCVGLFPMALPLAILISSVMVMGGMAEHYELSSIKSAGVPLLRVMRPLIFLGLLAALLSYYCSATLIPLANLQFGSRMYDIQQQKPSLNLSEGVFNDDFQGFSIHIGKKGTDGKSISDVLIYDQSENAKGQYSQITAKDGEMYAAQDGKYFVMNLKNGHQYVEVAPGGVSSTSGRYPFVRTSFKKYTKVFDMSEFALSSTDKSLFKSNKSMMSIPELSDAIDSMQLRMQDRSTSMGEQIKVFFTYLPADSAFQYKPLKDSEQTDSTNQPISINLKQNDTLKAKSDTIKLNKKPPVQVNTSYQQAILEVSSDVDPQTGEKINSNKLRKVQRLVKQKKLDSTKIAPVNTALPVEINRLDTVQKFANVFAQPDRLRMYDRAKTFVLSIQNQAESTMRSLQSMREQQVKYIYEMWTKYSIAVVCIIFVFVGAPMGAIVRKGGFGYPILVSIIFFMIFVILTIFCRKIAEAFVLPAAVAAWVPAMVLFPIGLLLTLKAMNDSKFNMNIAEGFKRLLDRFKRKVVKA